MNNGHINLAKSKAFIYISTDFEGHITFENRAARIYFNHISASRIQEISKEPLKDVINNPRSDYNVATIYAGGIDVADVEANRADRSVYNLAIPSDGSYPDV
jgi:hypothetical protein